MGLLNPRRLCFLFTPIAELLQHTICNHSDSVWMAALRRAGFLAGPSNYVFAISKELAKLLQPLPVNLPRIFMNRGDGEGPTRL